MKWNAIVIFAIFRIYWLMGKRLPSSYSVNNTRLTMPFEPQVEYLYTGAKDKSLSPSIRQESPPFFHGICATCGRKLEERLTRRRRRRIANNSRVRSPCGTNQCESCSRRERMIQVHFLHAHKERSSWQEKIQKFAHPSNSARTRKGARKQW